MLHLILGGARSGKSSFAESCILSLVTNKNPIYIATAKPFDVEMQQRIQHHQKQRQLCDWQLIECPEKLDDVLHDISADEYVLIDCLTLWLMNHLMLSETKKAEACISDYLNEQVDNLLATLNSHQANIILVSNEVGLGVVPMGEQTRLFVDHAGWLNQKLAKIADKVTLVTAGLPMLLKDISAVQNLPLEEKSRG